jgi:acylphosphatase
MQCLSIMGAMAGQETVAREVSVYGKVQGVFFRGGCQQEAERHGVGGWVSNESDGSVRAMFEGAQDDVDSMVAWCRHGPRGAVVERVDVVERNPSGLRRFTVR